MKKIFTLIAVAMVAMSASAKLVLTEMSKNEVFGIPADGTVKAWSWNQAQTNDSQAHEEPEGSGNWVTDKEATYDYSDATGFDFLVVKFKETCSVKLFCATGGWSKQVDDAAAAGASYVAIDFAAKGAVINDINAIIFQPTEDGKIIVESVEYMTKAEFDAYVEEQSHVVKEADFKNPAVNGVLKMDEGEDQWGWYSPGWFGTSVASLASLYKTMVFEVAQSDGPFKITIQDFTDEAQSRNIQFESVTVTEPVIFALPISDFQYSTLGQYAFQNNYVTETYSEGGADHSWLGENNIKITRTYYTSEVVKSTYTSSAGIQNITTASNANNAIYNLAGQRVANAKGIVIKNGAKYVVK